METPIFIQQETLADLAIDFPGATAVFNKYNLDYCCGGKQTLEQACAERDLPYEKILQEVMTSRPEAQGHTLRFHEWSTTFLTDFIEQNYHRYVRSSIPMVNELLTKVNAVHGVKHPGLAILKRQFELLAADLQEHMRKEEMVLFPAMRLYEQTGDSPNGFAFGNPIAVMLDDHQQAGDLLKLIRSQTNEYTAPSDACPTFMLLYEKMKEFDAELINHIHIENNILFKRFS
jgi:regulator of cell morphogenesis and NO signaling